MILDAASFDDLKVRTKRDYLNCIIACSSTSIFIVNYILIPDPISFGLVLVGGAITASFCMYYLYITRPIHVYEFRQEATREVLSNAISRCNRMNTNIFDNSPAARADVVIKNNLQKLKDGRERYNAHYAQLSWWGKMTHEQPSEMEKIDKAIVELERAEKRLHSEELMKAQTKLVNMTALSQQRIYELETTLLESIPLDHLKPYDEQLSAKSALLLSAMTVPASAWNDINQAANIYDTLREVNGNYEGMSDSEIWFDTLLMSSESPVGLVSLTKGAYFEKLIEVDFGGERFEHFNHPDTDIIIDGVAYQIKATDSVTYVESVEGDIPVITTSEVAGITGAIDGGYSDEEIENSVELSLGGTVIDCNDTALDALLTGVGGLSLLATIRGINHASNKHQEGGDLFDALLEGGEVAVIGTAKGMVDTAELAHKALTSKPMRFLGRASCKIIDKASRL